MEYFPIIKGIGYFIIFLLLFAAFYMLRQKVYLLEKAWDNFFQVYDELVDNRDVQIQELEKKRMAYGEHHEKGYLNKLDRLICYSRIQAKIPWLNAIAYIFLVGALFVAGLVLFSIALDGMVLPLLCAVGVAIVPRLTLMIMAKNNYNKVQRQFIQFINMLGNASQSSNDILSLLNEAASYMGEPIRSTVGAAVIRARVYGNVGSCIRKLCYELEYPLFGKFIRNLELCSRDDANYRKIVDEYRPICESVVNASSRIDALYLNGRVLGIVMVVLSFGVVWSAGSVGGLTLTDIVHLFMDDFLGNVVLAIVIILYAIAAYFVLFKRRL